MLSSFETLYSRLEHCNYKCWAKSLSRYISKCYIYNSSYAFFQNWDFQTFKELSKWGVWLNRDWSLKADTQKTAPVALGWPLWQQSCEQRKETGLWHSKLWFMKTVPPLLNPADLPGSYQNHTKSGHTKHRAEGIPCNISTNIFVLE